MLQKFRRAVIGLIPEFVKRWFVTPKQVASMYAIELSQAHPAVFFDVGDASYATVEVLVHNKGPVDATLDRVIAEVSIADITVTMMWLHREILQGFGTRKLTLRCELSEGQKSAMHRYGLSDLDCEVYAIAYFISLRWPIASDCKCKVGERLEVRNRKAVLSKSDRVKTPKPEPLKAG